MIIADFQSMEINWALEFRNNPNKVWALPLEAYRKYALSGQQLLFGINLFGKVWEDNRKVLQYLEECKSHNDSMRLIETMGYDLLWDPKNNRFSLFKDHSKKG